MHAPSREDPVVAPLTEFLGGPVGEQAAPRRWWTTVRVLLTVGTCAWVAGMLARTACATAAWEPSRGVRLGLCSEEWGWWGLARPGRALAGDLPPLPALVGHLVEAVARLRPDAQDRAVSAAVTTAVLLALCLCVAVVVLTRVRPRRGWDAAVLAFSPLLALTWFTSWHTVAAVAVAVALWAWSSGRRILAGVAVGAAASTVLASGLLLVGFALGARAGRTRTGVVGGTVTAAALTWLLLGTPRLLGAAESAWWVRGIDLGSPWLVVLHVVDSELSTRVITVAALVLWACWALVVARVLRRAPRGDAAVVEAARVTLLLLGGAFVVSPWLPATAGLVLLPLAAVAVRRWGPLLVWQACDLLYVVVLGLHVAGALAPATGQESPFLWLAIGIRVVGIGVLLWSAMSPPPGESGDDDAVEAGRGVADPDLDLLADLRHPRS